MLALLFALLTFTVTGLVRCLASPVYTWDLDHEMYFGGQLLRGDLIYTLEFNDKTPIVQFLFAIPASLGSIKVLKSVCLALFLLYLAVSLIAATHLTQSVFPPLRSFQRKLVISVIAFTLVTPLATQQESILNITTMSVSLCGMGLFTLYHASIRNSFKSALVLILSLTLLSIATSLRPFYLPCLTYLVALSAIFPFGSYSITHTFLRAIRRLFGFLAILTLLNSLPYIVTGALPALKNGVSFLQSNIHGLSLTQRIFKFYYTAVDIYGQNGNDRLSFLLYSGASFLSLYLLTRAWPKSLGLAIGRTSLLLFSTIPILLLVLTIGLKNSRYSYYVLLSPFFLIPLTILTLYLSRTALPSRPFGILQNSIAVLFFLVVGGYLRYFHDAKASISSSSREEMNLSVLKKHTRNGQERFLFLNSMAAHWVFEEPRRGFPHAANITHLLKNDWSSTMPSIQHLLRDPVALCEKIKTSTAINVFLVWEPPAALDSSHSVQAKFLAECLHDSPTYSRYSDGEVVIYKRQ